MRLPFEQYQFPIRQGTSPYKHQIETVKFLLLNNKSYCFNDMGTGKTLSALWAADFLIINEKINRALVVCPLSTMMSTWARDIFWNMPHRRYAIAHGSRDNRIRALNSKAEFVIINHDGLGVIEQEILNSNIDLLIIDEVTAYKNYSAKRTKIIEKIARKMKGVWSMTGIPTPNSPLEAYGIAKVTNPTNPFLPKYFTQYRNFVMEKINQFIWIPKPGANKLVHKILQPAIRYAREDCIDLPPVTYEVREVELTQEQNLAYTKMSRDLMIEYEQGSISAVNAGVKLNKLLQIASGAVKDDLGVVIRLNCSNRLNELYDIFEETPQKKLVVFAAFRASVEMITEFFKTKKVSVAIIYGSTDHRDRNKAIKSFQDGDLNVLVIQPQAASHGITLTAANTVVWYSLLASNEIYDQANHRIIRIGQTRAQLIIHLIGCKAEKHLLNLLENKEAQSTDLLKSFKEFLA